MAVATVACAAAFPAAAQERATVAVDDSPTAIQLLAQASDQAAANPAESARLIRQGVRDMVRVSDARMSGTAYGTVVLHVSPESEAGGPLALVRTGDRVRLSARRGTLDLLVDEAELAVRRAAWAPAPPRYDRGYASLYVGRVLQAHQGADLDFLVGKDTRPITRESH